MSTTPLTPLHVVVVDDDAEIRELVRHYLQMNGIETREAASSVQLDAELAAAPIQVVLLDVNLGYEDGFAIARRLRERGDWHGGIIMLTGRGDLVDRVVGLEIGADDYVAKPFELRELLARVKSVARRVTAASAATPTDTAPTTETAAKSAPKAAGKVYCFDGYELDLDARSLNRRTNGNDAAPVALTAGEFELLAVLVQNPQRVLSRDQVLQATHGRDAGPFDRTVDVQIGRLRRKLGDDGEEPQLIKAVRGAGYMFAAAVSKR